MCSKILAAIHTLLNFRPEKGTVDAILIMRRMQEEYQKKEQEVVCVLLTWKRLLIESKEKWSGPREKGFIKSNDSGSYELV